MARLQDLEKQINDILLFARNGDNQVVAPLSVQGLAGGSAGGGRSLLPAAGLRLASGGP